MHDITTVTFDAAGTLIHVARPVGETYAEVVRTHGASISSEVLEEGFRSAFTRMPPLAFISRDDAHLIEQERNWWSALVRQAVTPDGVIADFDGFFETLYAYFSEGSAWCAYPEAASVLRSLKSRGYRVGIVSNFDSRLEAILKELGLDRWADVTVYSSRVGAAKPSPAIFRHALELLGAQPHESLHVGDNHEADYEGAQAAGMCAAIVNRKSEDDPDDGVIRIRSLEQVDQLLR